MGQLGTGKLGNSKLGSAGAREVTADDVRDRMDTVVKSAFPHEQNNSSTWDGLLWTLAYEHSRLHDTIDDIRDSRDVTEASLAQLDNIGELFGLTRFTDESDAHFRKRIQMQWPKYTTRTTIDEIVETSAFILDCAPQDIEVREAHNTEPARVDVFVNPIVIENSDLSVDEFLDILRDVKAAGVKIQGTAGDLFTYRGLGDSNDPNKAYDNAPYADLITARYDGGPVFGSFAPGGYGDAGYGEGEYGFGTDSYGD